MEGAPSPIPEVVNDSENDGFQYMFLISIWFAVVFSICLVVKFCQNRDGPPEPARQQLYREPAPPPKRFWEKGAHAQCHPEVTFEPYNGLQPISFNSELTEAIVTNPHVFVAFCLTQPYSAGSDSSGLLTMLAEIGEAIGLHGDGIQRKVVAANCSRDFAMATKHKVNQFPTISYYRYGYYYCDYCGEQNQADLFRFIMSVVRHAFPQRSN